MSGFFYEIDMLASNYPIAMAIIDVLIKSSLIIVSAFFLHFLYRNKPASNISLIWLMTLVAILAIPVVRFILPALNISIDVPLSPSEYNNVSTTTGITRVVEQKLLGYLTPVYVCGVLIMAGYLCLGIFRIRQLLADATPLHSESVCNILRRLEITNGVRTTVKLGVSDKIITPMTAGIFKHTILLPASSLSWDATMMNQVLAHELGHIQRNDWVHQLISRICLCFNWLNPLVWVAVGILKIETEKACDDAAIECSSCNEDYAASLLKIAGNARRQNSILAMGWLFKPTTLSKRIQYILAPGNNRAILRSSEIIPAVLFSFILAIPLSALTISVNHVLENDSSNSFIPLVMARDNSSEKNYTSDFLTQPENRPADFPTAALSSEESQFVYFRHNNGQINSNSFPVEAKWEFTIPRLTESITASPEYIPIYLPAPDYPGRARELGIEGYVVVKFDINNAGRTTNTSIIESVPQGTFDISVLNAVDDFIFCPEFFTAANEKIFSVTRKYLFSLAGN